MMALCSSIYGSHYSKVGLVVLGLGVIFHVTGYSVADWERLVIPKVGDARMGIWKQCMLSECLAAPNEGWLLAVRILESLSLALEVASVVGVAIYMYRGSRPAVFTTAALALVSGVITMSGAAVYWAYHDDEADLYWGFAFVVIGALNCLAAGAIFIYEGIKRTGYVSLR